MDQMTSDRSAKDRLREQGAVLGEDIHEMGRLTNEIAREKYEQGKAAAADLYRRGQDRLTEYVQTQPLRTVAIAAACGVVVGLLLGRRR